MKHVANILVVLMGVVAMVVRLESAVAAVAEMVVATVRIIAAQSKLIDNQFLFYSLFLKIPHLRI
ncbi:MAG: hypothetical protein ACJ0QZ_00735 [Gammaproteobacteria bacterium]